MSVLINFMWTVLNFYNDSNSCKSLSRNAKFHIQRISYTRFSDSSVSNSVSVEYRSSYTLFISADAAWSRGHCLCAKILSVSSYSIIVIKSSVVFLVTISKLYSSLIFRTGIYSLTRDHELTFIDSCEQRGFHPHPKEPPIYEVNYYLQACLYS